MTTIKELRQMDRTEARDLAVKNLKIITKKIIIGVIVTVAVALISQPIVQFLQKNDDES